MSEEDRKDYRSLGEILREARESQKKSIQDLSDVTKIAPRILRALESDDLDQVADPIYAKSFVRSLAETLRLDADWLLTKLQHAQAASKTRDTAEPASREESTWHIDNVRIQRVEAPRRRLLPRVVVGVALLLAVALVGLWFVRQGNGGAVSPGRSTEDGVGSLTFADSGPPLGTDALTADPFRPAPSEPAGEEIQETRPGSGASGADGEASAPERERAEPAAARPDPEPAREEPVDPSPARRTPPPPAEAVTAAPTRADTPAEESAPAKAPAEESSSPEASREESAPADASGEESAPAEEVIVDETTTGLSSIVRRPDSEEEADTMILMIRATGRVEVHVAVDGGAAQERTLSDGEVWELEGQDHFSVQMSDPRRVEVALDGVRHDPPPGLVGEWILYPNPSPR